MSLCYDSDEIVLIYAFNNMGVRELTPSQVEFFEACRRGDIEKVKNYIASKKSKKTRTPLNFLRPSTPSPGWLSSYKDPSTQYTPLHNASLHGHHHICKILIESDRLLTSARDKRGCVPLHLASWNGHFEAMKLLVEFDTDSVDVVNNAQESPLHLAAQHGHDKVVRVLLEHHADPRLRNARFETPLDVAARTGHAVVCKILVGFCPELALQSAVDCSSTGENGQIRAQVVYPLHAAARHSHIQCLQILRLGGFDIDFVTDEGSALHVAAVFGQVEAVKYLTEEGINPHIRDSKGRTALEVLREHEGNQTSDLTYIIQSREGWSECRKIIDSYIQRLESEHFNSSSDSGIDRRDSERSIVDEEVIGDIWRPLPSGAHATSTSKPSLHDAKEPLNDGRSSAVQNATVIAVGNHNSSSTNPAPAKEITLDDTFVRTICPQPYPAPIHRTWNSRMYDAERGIARFPLTSPVNKTRHQQSKRISDTLPLKFNALRTTIPSRGSLLSSDSPCCIYRAPPVYDMWYQKFVQNDGTTHTYNPAYPYDNIPRNVIVYDNAPTPGHSRWNHDCSSSSGKASDLSMLASPRQEQIQTITTSRPRTRPSVLNAFTSAFETLEERSQDDKKDSSSMRGLETSNDSNLSPQFSSRKNSTTTFGCSTLGRSSSPVGFSSSNPSGRAPLAMPEELTGSTSTSILSSSVTPERESTAQLTSSNISTATSSTPNASIDDRLGRNNRSSMEISLSTLTIDYSDMPPSPNSSRSKIFNKLCFNSKACDKTSPSKEFPFSPAATECSDGTITSSCSLPVVSRISTTPPSDTSFYKLYHQNSGDESPPSVVKLRSSFDTATERTSAMDLNKANESINEIEEWKKIDDILSSFGGAVCRESVFAANYESQVAVFLRDCRSQALTLQLTSQPSTYRHSLNNSSLSTCKPESEYTTLSQWLCTTVGIPNPKAAEVGQILTRAGFDRLRQLHGCLTARELSALGIEKPIQQQILTYLDSVTNVKPNAYSFNYVSDWLCSLELTDYLGNFVTAGLKTMVLVRSAGLTRDHLEKMGITLPGHIARILYSLVNTRVDEVYHKREEMKNIRELDIPSSSNILRETPSETTISFSENDDTENGYPARTDLLHTHASFSAHYLGSMEISNIDGTEESRRAMAKLKKTVRVIAKVPEVILEISIHGVRILDGRTGRLAVEHEISQIQIVCQDERDLNCFTYISQDLEKNLCHVFCVLTAVCLFIITIIE
ncbi:hypothetical protein KIN20_024230 [Parelaphostrongylus tenuis]|uniref:Ankyrin repeat and sterile alpha motif domain-containing protein 1B n=1 Tax=Parelaphostrongylus tenuis TaxID=148309 RepID=A0AAD5NCP6_PARTN|nr:hypothetical protein KIN20_024230 [Parelaphostrongylus tenuis]